MVYMKREDETNGLSSSPMRSNAPKLWILVEYRTMQTNGKKPIKNYEVVDAKDVCGAGGRGNTRLEAMHTGKIVYVKKDSLLVQATIVTISDDKAFLDTELKDLMELPENLHQNKKRKRAHTPNSKVSPSPSVEHQINHYQRWNSHESTNGSPTQSVIMSNPNVQNCPPMTFDQQTQTDFKHTNSENPMNDSRLQKILLNTENVLRGQHNLNIENQEMKQQINNLSNQMTEVKSMLKELLVKFDHNKNGNNKRNHDGNSAVLVNVTENSPAPKAISHVQNPPRILNLSHPLSTSHQYYNSISIEPVEASNDSSMSFSNNSRMSLSASNQSIYHNLNETSMSESTYNNSNNSTSTREYNVSKQAESLNDDDDVNGDDEVTIGSNNTTVPRSVLANINWSSYRAATRRLLSVKFSREVLATHSLTGKPSPGELSMLYSKFPQIFCDCSDS